MNFSLLNFGDRRDDRDDPFRLLIEGENFAGPRDFQVTWMPESHFPEFEELYLNPGLESENGLSGLEDYSLSAAQIINRVEEQIQMERLVSSLLEELKVVS